MKLAIDFVGNGLIDYDYIFYAYWLDTKKSYFLQYGSFKDALRISHWA